MTINASEPTDQRLVSELPYYIRQTRTFVNALADECCDGGDPGDYGSDGEIYGGRRVGEDGLIGGGRRV